MDMKSTKFLLTLTRVLLLSNTGLVSVAAPNPYVVANSRELPRYSDLLATAEKTNCATELEAVGASDLLRRPVQTPLWSPIFEGIRQLGTPAQAFNLLVVEPHLKLAAVSTRSEFDRAWKALERALEESAGGNVNDPAAVRQWRAFESAAMLFHRCYSRAAFKLDPVEERTKLRGQIIEAEREAIDHAKRLTGATLAHRIECEPTKAEEWGPRQSYELGENGIGWLREVHLNPNLNPDKRVTFLAILHWKAATDRANTFMFDPVIQYVAHHYGGPHYLALKNQRERSRFGISLTPALREGEFEVTPIRWNGNFQRFDIESFKDRKICRLEPGAQRN